MVRESWLDFNMAPIVYIWVGWKSYSFEVCQLKKQNGYPFHAREQLVSIVTIFGDARELKIFGEHNPSLRKCLLESFLPLRQNDVAI